MEFYGVNMRDAPPGENKSKGQANNFAFQPWRMGYKRGKRGNKKYLELSLSK